MTASKHKVNVHVGLDPESVERLQASARLLGEELGRLVSQGLEPLSDALTIAFGPQRAARLEHEAAAAADPAEAANLAGEAAQVSAAVTRALRRVERRRQRAEADRARAASPQRDGE